MKKESFKDKVSAILMERIKSGELSAGEHIKEAHLAKEFGISQSPVREAIIALISTGMLEHSPNVGTKVKSFTNKEIKDIYQIRVALELFAAQNAIEEINKNLTKFENIYQKMIKIVKKVNYEKFEKLDKEFHSLIIHALDNDTLYEVWQEQYNKTFVSKMSMMRNTNIKNAVELHVPIIEAIKNKSSEKLELAIKDHYKRLLDNKKLNDI